MKEKLSLFFKAPLSIRKYKKALLVGAFFLMLGSFGLISPKSASASCVGGNVSGWAWSSYIGWISFDCVTGGGTNNYGVSVNPTTGDFSGHAWSSNIGWISFEPSDIGICPAATPAKINLNSGEVTGWARALAGGTGNSGNWDGCIKLSDNQYFKSPTPNGTGGVTYDKTTNQLFGNAWGSDVVGWVNFFDVSVAPLKNAPYVDLQIEYGTQKGPNITVGAKLPMTPTLYWTLQNVTSCTRTSLPADTKWSNFLGLSTGSGTPNPITVQGLYSYTIRCIGTDGATYTDTANILVKDLALSKPSIFLEVSDGIQPKAQNLVVMGGGATPVLYWTGVDLKPGSCVPTSNPAQPSWNSSFISPVNAGQITAGPVPAGTYTYTLTCIGLDNQTYTSTATLDVNNQNPNAPLVITITANGSTGPVSLNVNDTPTIAWSAINATSCEINSDNDGFWTPYNTATSGVVIATKGSFVAPKITKDTYYHVTCMNNLHFDDAAVQIIIPVVTPSCTVSALNQPMQMLSKGPATSTASGILLGGAGGFIGPVDLSVSGNYPAGKMGGVFSISPISVGTASTLTFVSSGTVPPGTYTATVTAQPKAPSTVPACTDTVSITVPSGTCPSCPSQPPKNVPKFEEI